MPHLSTPFDHSKYITRDAATRAIYLDFEGRPSSPPDLAGVLIEERFRHVVLNAALASAAKAHRLEVVPLRSLVAELVAQCRKEGRLLVAFSEHELVVVRKYCGRDLRGVYRNARAVAKRWRNQKYPGHPLYDYSLKSFLDFIRNRRPSSVTGFSPADSLRTVRSALDSAPHSAFGAASAKARSAWATLLRYNKHDCLGMRELMKRAAEASVGRVP